MVPKSKEDIVVNAEDEVDVWKSTLWQMLSIGNRFNKRSQAMTYLFYTRDYDSSWCKCFSLKKNQTTWNQAVWKWFKQTIGAGSNALQLKILIHLLQPHQTSILKRPLAATPAESSNVTYNIIMVRSNLIHLSLYAKFTHHLRWLYLLYCSMTLPLYFLNSLFLYTKMWLNISLTTFFVLPILTAFCKCIKYVYNTKALLYKVLRNVFWYYNMLTYA